MILKRPVSLSLLSALLIPLTGYIGCSTPPSRFYLLEPIPNIANQESLGKSKILVALAPVKIPKYADRPQIVSATAKNAYQLSELNRWAEALDFNISRVLAQNLSLLTPAEVFLTNASNLAKEADFRISVSIFEFHVDPQGQAGLTAQWQVTQGGDRLLSRQISYRLPASTSDYGLMVEALNECLNRMSRDIATSLQQIVDEKKASYR